MSSSQSDDRVADFRPQPTAVAFEVGVAVVLFVCALWLRRAVPHDGLNHDDSWQAFAATTASPHQLYIAGQTQPGFNVLLAAWSRAFGAAPATMVIPAMIAGALGPFLLYLGLRWFLYGRSVALLMAAMLSVSTTHVLFSSRVKVYTADVLIVLLLAIVVDRLCDRAWDARIAALWIVIAVVATAMTPIGPLVVVAAGLTIVLHPRGDLRLRCIAIGVEFAAIAVYVRAIAHTFNTESEKAFWRNQRGFIQFSANPVQFGREITRHLVQVMQTFPGGPQPWPDVVLVVVGVGLALACWHGRRAVSSRFLVLATLLAAGASVAQLAPFAPLGPSAVDGRVTLWLIPVVGIGLAEILELLRREAVRRRAAHRVFDLIVPVIAACVLLSAVGTTHPYRKVAGAGGRAATRFVMAHLATHDAVWITRDVMYSFALAAGANVRLRPTPHELVGFEPAFTDPRLIAINIDPHKKQLWRSVRHATRVWLVVPPAVWSPQYQFMLRATLTQYGFVRFSRQNIQDIFVEQWNRNTPTGAP